jgi:PKHD-type hydroxylase
MLVHIKHVLSDSDLSKVQELLQTAKFRDGKLSAGKVARQVKNNLEVEDEKLISALNNIVMNNVVRHPDYQMAALPYKIASPFYARYTAGMEYGEHIDDPIMGPSMNPADRYRSDLAMTIFLNSPEQYDGGDLVIHTPFGKQHIKSDAGDAVLYPATTRHQVMEVTNGERLVAVTWIQSLVRENEHRYLLYQLGKTREKFLRKDPDSEDTKRIDHTYVNLVRMWSEV